MGSMAMMWPEMLPVVLAPSILTIFALQVKWFQRTAFLPMMLYSKQ